MRTRFGAFWQVFMASIEKVTSVKKQITNKDTGKKTTVKASKSSACSVRAESQEPEQSGGVRIRTGME